MDLVVDESGCGLAYAPAAFCEWCSPCGGTGRAGDVIEQCLAKTGSSLVVVLSDTTILTSDF
jgi:hypothetical protein